MKETKKYEAPQMKAYQVKPANIIATSTETLGLQYDDTPYTF